MEYGSCYMLGYSAMCRAKDANDIEYETVKMAWRHIYEYLSSSFACNIHDYMPFGKCCCPLIVKYSDDVCCDFTHYNYISIYILVLCGNKVGISDR